MKTMTMEGMKAVAGGAVTAKVGGVSSGHGGASGPGWSGGGGNFGGEGPYGLLGHGRGPCGAFKYTKGGTLWIC